MVENIEYRTSLPVGRQGILNDEVKNKSTIPHTFAVIATMDILGYLIGNLKDAGDTAKNSKEFLIGKVDDTQQLNCLLFLFRHGMGHSFFPKKEWQLKLIQLIQNHNYFSLIRMI